MLQGALVGVGGHAKTGGRLDRFHRAPHFAMPCRIAHTDATKCATNGSADLEPHAGTDGASQQQANHAADR